MYEYAISVFQKDCNSQQRAPKITSLSVPIKLLRRAIRGRCDNTKLLSGFRKGRKRKSRQKREQRANVASEQPAFVSEDTSPSPEINYLKAFKGLPGLWCLLLLIQINVRSLRVS